MSTILKIVQDASVFIGIDEPDQLFGSIEQESRELSILVNRCATLITQDYDWQALARLAKFTGDGTAEEFELPDDYGRMNTGAVMKAKGGSTRFTYHSDLNEWLEIMNGQSFSSGHSWTTYDDKVHMLPALGVATEARFFYQSKHLVKEPDGTKKEKFTADNDEFRLDEELMRLALVYRYKAFKKMPYAEEEGEFFDRLKALQASDQPAKTITIGGG